MRQIHGLVMIVLLAVGLVGQAQEKNAKAQKTVMSDGPPGKAYVYKHSAGKPRTMEIYFPTQHDPKSAKAPGLILFHGGGWGGGTLGQFRVACAYFASRGMVCATAEYRMLSKEDTQRLPAGETRKRVCITDAKSAIRWFKQHADELGIDPRRIITGGGSAGGHIAVLATTNPELNDPADPPGIDVNVIAYVLFNPAFAVDDDKDPQVDVVRHLKADLPPALVFFGTEDAAWLKGWQAANAKLKSLGSTAIDLQMANGQTHGFFNRDPWQTVTFIAADRFLMKQGVLTGDPKLVAPATGERLTPATP